MEITVTSKESIKPSKPTPQHHKIFNLSSFDLLHRNTYFPLILFYPQITNPNYNNVSSRLKKSLSETLTIFYPLAGRRNDAVSISCNDEGALFLEATANVSISEFLDPPRLESLNRLLPCEPYKLLQEGEAALSSSSSPSLPHLAVQVTSFECGGVAIGLCNLHAVMDACSCGVMTRTWSAICREERDDIAWPDYESAFALFPPRDFSDMRAGLLSVGSKIEAQCCCTVQRFVFTHEAMDKLKGEAKDNDSSSRIPSRYEAVSGLMAKHMILSYGSPSPAAVVLHIVDVRRRMGEPLSSNTMGNLLWPAMVSFPGDAVNRDTTMKDMVRMTRERMSKINRDLFLRMQEDGEFLRSDECGELLLEGIEKKRPISCVMTSWSNLGFNELDFGWGRPVWVGFRGGTQPIIPNTVVFIDTQQGMEAWVTMPHQRLAVLENDVDFLTFALLNPSVSSHTSR